MADQSQAPKDPVVDDNELEQDPDVGMAGMEESRPPPSQAAPQATDLPMPFSPPTRKDATLREFLGKMDEYAPIIPDAVTAHYLALAGLAPPPIQGQPANPNSTPPQLARLIALATQKFIADIAADSYQYSRIRAGNTSTTATNPLGIPGQPGGLPGAAGAAGGDKGKAGGGREAHLGQARPGYGGGGQGGSGQGKTVLTMEDLGMAVGEYGLNIRRSEFYR